MALGPSLFAANTGPVLPAATEWVTGTLFGDVAIALCVIAVAFVGFMLMSGRLVIREGLRVAIGCFVLLGAPIIATGLRSAANDAAITGSPQELTIDATSPPTPLPAASYDPYAGASLRRD